MIFVIITVLLGCVPYGCDLVQGNTPMIIYGKVVDQMGNPIANTAVDFTASAVPRLQPPFLLAEPRRVKWPVSATTDQDGYFCLNGGRGIALDALRPGELGYQKGAIPNNFYFGRRTDGNIYHPDPKNPTVFMWWNDAYKRIVRRTVSCQPPLGRAYTVEYLSGAMTNTAGGFENIEIFVHRPPAGRATPFDWSVDIRARDGGLVPTDKELGPEAPETGYGPEVHYFVSANDPHWSRRLVRRFYTRNHGYEIGKPIYAGVELSVVLDDKDDASTVTVHYTADFGNSRDLVAGPVKPVVK